MEEFENRYVIGKPADINTSAQSPRDSLSEEERRARIEKVIAAFGTIEYHPDYDYKKGRWRRTRKTEEPYANWDLLLSNEELEAHLPSPDDPA